MLFVLSRQPKTDHVIHDTIPPGCLRKTIRLVTSPSNVVQLVTYLSSVLCSAWPNHLNLLIHFTGHFPGGPGLAGSRMSPFWILLELRMMEVVLTTGAIRLAKLQSNHHPNNPPPIILQAGCPSRRSTNKPWPNHLNLPFSITEVWAIFWSRLTMHTAFTY